MTIRTAPILASAFVFLLVSSTAQAETKAPVGTKAPVIQAPALAPNTDAHARPLGIDEAISLGVQNNLGVQVNRYTPYVAQYEAEAAWGAYDPLFEGDVFYGEQTEQNAIITNAPNEADQLNGGVGISALLPYWGGRVNVDFDASRAHTDFALERLSPKYNSGLTLGVTAPLLRGLIWNEPWTQVKVSELAYGSQIDDFTTAVMNTVLAIVTDYWALVANQEKVRVAEKSLESNQALLDQTKIQYEVGVVSKVEVIQAEAGVANSEFNLILTRNEYLNSQDRLIASVLGDRLRADTTLQFQPTDNPAYTGAEPVDLNRAVAIAFAQRPELAAAHKQIEQGEVGLKFAKNQRLPRLDVNFQYRTDGTTGELKPPLPDPFGPEPTNTGNFGDTFDTYYRSGGPRELSAMALVSIPLGNTRGRKNVSKARVQLRQAESLVTQLEQNIIVSVRRAARSLLASALGVEASERRRIAAAEQLRAENIRLEHGESTPFDVLQRERDLVDAESQKISALQAYRVSQAALQREEGTILADRNVVIEQVRKLD